MSERRDGEQLRMEYLNFDLRWQRRYLKRGRDVPSKTGGWLYAGIGASCGFDRKCTSSGYHLDGYPFRSYSLLCSFFVKMDRWEKTILFDRALKTPGAAFRLYRAKSDLTIAVPISGVERRMSWFFDRLDTGAMINWQCYLDGVNSQCPYYMENVIHDENRR